MDIYDVQTEKGSQLEYHFAGLLSWKT
jgi:hypothetical protein